MDPMVYDASSAKSVKVSNLFSDDYLRYRSRKKGNRLYIVTRQGLKIQLVPIILSCPGGVLRFKTRHELFANYCQ
jgi:hypothetical protein